MNPLRRKVKIARFNIPLILILLATGGTVLASAVSYVVLQFSVNVTVEQNPKVTFLKWADGTKANTFAYAVSIFPNIKTIDENITHGIWCDDGSPHTCYLRISSVATATNIAKLNVTIYDVSSTVYTKEWTSFSPLPTSWESFTAGANKKYSIWMEITGATGATGTSSVTFEMKPENP